MAAYSSKCHYVMRVCSFQNFNLCSQRENILFGDKLFMFSDPGNHWFPVASLVTFSAIGESHPAEQKVEKCKKDINIDWQMWNHNHKGNWKSSKYRACNQTSYNSQRRSIIFSYSST